MQQLKNQKLNITKELRRRQKVFTLMLLHQFMAYYSFRIFTKFIALRQTTIKFNKPLIILKGTFSYPWETLHQRACF